LRIFMVCGGGGARSMVPKISNDYLLVRDEGIFWARKAGPKRGGEKKRLTTTRRGGKENEI